MATNTALQPKAFVIRPPMTGPKDDPAYTEATDVPSTLPRLLGGYTSKSIAVFVANIIAEPMPCSTRKNKKNVIFGAKIFKAAAMQNKRIPLFKIGLRPYISPILPIGIDNSAETIRKDMTIQASEVAEAENSLPICGTAIFRDDAANVFAKFEIIVTINVALCIDF